MCRASRSTYVNSESIDRLRVSKKVKPLFKHHEFKLCSLWGRVGSELGNYRREYVFLLVKLKFGFFLCFIYIVETKENAKL